jgi:FkbM family methyltransferase
MDLESRRHHIVRRTDQRPILTRLRAAVRRRVFIRRLGRLPIADPGPHPIVYLGSSYGGYGVPDGLIDSGWICYCAGTGADISFDLALIERYGCRVFACEPAPEAQRVVQEASAGIERFSFLPVGLAPSDGTMTFYRAAHPQHMALSTTDLQVTGDPVEAPVRSVDSLMRELGHERVDLLKLAVEGTEYELLESLDLRALGVRLLLVEFTWSQPASAAFAATRRLRASGYVPVYRNLADVTFVHESAL